MPFKKVKILTKKREKVPFFIEREFKLNGKETQRLIARGRVFKDKKVLKIGDFIEENEEIEVLIFVPNSKNINPFFENQEFAVFNKPSGILVHPTNRFTEYSLLDEIRFLYGKDANLVHRLDIETSGTILVAKNRISEKKLKNIFENREIQKEYLALVRGKLDQKIEINQNLKEIKQIEILKNGEEIITSFVTVDTQNFASPKKEKTAQTTIIPIKYDEIKNQTLVKAIPFTGRRHQIRVHLDFIGHSIVGDPIYGVSEEIRKLYLTKQLSEKKRIEILDSTRLQLHSEILKFNFKNQNFFFKSEFK